MANPSIFNREEFVRVTNGSDALIEGRFAGDDYEFPPGETVDIHLAAAQHIFGFGDDDKMRALTRLGWLQTSADLKPAMARLALVTFGDVPGIEKVTSIRQNPSTRAPSLLGDGTAGAGDLNLPAPEDLLAESDDGTGEQSEVM